MMCTQCIKVSMLLSCICIENSHQCNLNKGSKLVRKGQGSTLVNIENK